MFLAFRYRKRSAAKDDRGNRAELGTGFEGNGKVELGDTGLLEAEKSIPTSVDEVKAVALLKEKEKKIRASTLDAREWRMPAEKG